LSDSELPILLSINALSEKVKQAHRLNRLQAESLRRAGRVRFRNRLGNLRLLKSPSRAGILRPFAYSVQGSHSTGCSMRTNGALTILAVTITTEHNLWNLSQLKYHQFDPVAVFFKKKNKKKKNSRRTFHPDAISDCGLRKAHKPQIPRFRKCIPIPVRHRSSTQQLEKLRKVLGLRTVHDLAAKRVFLGRLPSYYLLLTFLLSREGHKEARSVPSQLNIFALFGQGTRRDLKASFISSLTSNIKYFH
jgi:hypothetical protein